MKLNRNQLKYLLIVAMVIDHIAWALVPTESWLGESMHFIGRLTGPCMALLLGEGYRYTKNKKKYAIRLLIFSLISWIPIGLFEHRTLFYFGMDMFGMIWTLFIAFLNILMWDKLKANKTIKVILVIFACALSLLGDWCIFAVLWALFSYIYYDRPKNKWIAFSCVAVSEVLLSLTVMGTFRRNLFQLGVVMVPFLYTYCYNGKTGSKAKFHKWVFYIFYPAHLLIIYFIRLNILGY